MKKCQWCGEDLRFIPGKGYVHQGGGLYVQRCDQCGLKASFRETRFRCPSCGGDLKDDHCALPVG